MTKTIIRAIFMATLALVAGHQPATAAWLPLHSADFLRTDAVTPQLDEVPDAVGQHLVRRPRARAVRRGAGRPVVVVTRRPVLAVRPWRHRPHYGAIIAGVALGTVIGVAVARSAPPPPQPGLCWYWADAGGTRGYWDYCN